MRTSFLRSISYNAIFLAINSLIGYNTQILQKLDVVIGMGLFYFFLAHFLSGDSFFKPFKLNILLKLLKSDIMSPIHSYFNSIHTSYHISRNIDSDLIWRFGDHVKITKLTYDIVNPFILQAWVSLYTVLKTANLKSHQQHF